MTTINVQFSDDKQTKIVSIFNSIQDDAIYKNQAEIELSDVRYKAFYDGLPLSFQQTLPVPS